jgi:hypothetical protein
MMLNDLRMAKVAYDTKADIFDNEKLVVDAAALGLGRHVGVGG